jgi:hypothetical protein
MRDSYGLEENDKLMFALRWSQIYLELLEKNAAAMATGTTNSSPAAFDAPSDVEAGICWAAG